MGVMSRTMPMATFIRDYATVLNDVEVADDEVVLERRAGRASFVLAPLRRTESDRHAVDALAHVLRNALAHGDLVDVISASLLGEYPWVAFLPDHEKDRFARELMDTLRACASIGRFTAFENLIDSWTATAEVWSDSDLARALSAAVEVPEGTDVPTPASR